MSGTVYPFPNTPLWHGAQLKHMDNFTFTLLFIPTLEFTIHPKYNEWMNECTDDHSEIREFQFPRFLGIYTHINHNYVTMPSQMQIVTYSSI
jgi:hypothetical protein